MADTPKVKSADFDWRQNEVHTSPCSLCHPGLHVNIHNKQTTGPSEKKADKTNEVSNVKAKGNASGYIVEHCAQQE